MQNQERADQIQGFAEICKQHQLKLTPQRVAIFQLLLDSTSHPTADAVYQKLKQEYPSVSYDTISRTLQTFTEIGLLDVVEGFGGAKRFDPNVNHHHHLHCTRCGKIFDFENRAYDDIDIPEDIDQDFQVISRRVVLKGICKECQKSKRK